MKFPLIILSSLAVLCGQLFAQDAPPVIPGLPKVAAAPKKVDPAIVQRLKTEGLQFVNVTGQEVADWYHDVTQKRVLVHSQAADAEFRLIQPAPLTVDQAISIVEKQLLLEGFALVPSGPNEVKLVLRQNLEGEGPRIFDNPDDLPEGDAVVIYAMKLTYLKPDEASRTFQQLMGTAAAGNKVVSVPNAASILITAKTPVIRTLIETKKHIDVASSVQGSRWVPLKYADVEVMTEVLEGLFGGTNRGGRNTAAVQRTTNRAANARSLPNGVLPNSGSGGTFAGEEAPPQIIPDTRTNRIYLLGRPVDLVFIEGVIKDFDIPSDNRNFLKRKLKFLPVADFLDVAEDALTALNSSSSSQGPGGARSQATNRNRNQGQNRNTGGGATAGGGSGARGDTLQAPEEGIIPESRIVGRTLLIADNISNSLIVNGPPQSIEAVTRLLDQMDVRSEQVMISAIFGQLTLRKENSTGFNILKAISSTDDTDLVGGGGGGGASPFDIDGIANGTTTGLTVPGVSNGALSSGLSVYGKIADFSVYLRALEQDSNFSVLARPAVFTTNNNKAVISSGRRVAIPTGTSQSFGNTSNFNTNIEYQDVVLKLEVIPLVNSKDEVTLQIALISDDIGARVDVGDLTNVPEIITREIITTVTVPNKGTIALGGLVTVRDTFDDSGVPILKDVPLLGRLFSSKDKVDERDELIIFIQPTIISTDQDREELQRKIRKDHEISDAVMKMSEGDMPEQPTKIDLSAELDKYYADKGLKGKEVEKSPSKKPGLFKKHKR